MLAEEAGAAGQSDGGAPNSSGGSMSPPSGAPGAAGADAGQAGALSNDGGNGGVGGVGAGGVAAAGEAGQGAGGAPLVNECAMDGSVTDLALLTEPIYQGCRGAVVHVPFDATDSTATFTCCGTSTSKPSYDALLQGLSNFDGGGDLLLPVPADAPLGGYAMNVACPTQVGGQAFALEINDVAAPVVTDATASISPKDPLVISGEIRHRFLQHRRSEPQLHQRHLQLQLHHALARRRRPVRARYRERAMRIGCQSALAARHPVHLSRKACSANPMGRLWAMLACAGLGGVLFGCGPTKREPDPILQFPSAAGTAAAGAGTGVAGAGAGGAAGGPVEMRCAADMNPDPPPPTAITSAAGNITGVAPSAGCGRDYECEPYVKRTLQTMGTKAADCADTLDGKHICGAWSVPRDFWVMLPPGYDRQKPYPLVIEAPACGGTGPSVYGLDHVRDQVIRVGISPGPNSTGHATNPKQGCFDDHEGDDSIDWVFYERLYDRLNDELCFDRQRVFASGDSSGGTFANELGCKYAGDSLRPLRGVHAYNSSPPTEPQYLPTCGSLPFAGLWVQEVLNAEHPVEAFKANVSRAMAVAQCPFDYDHAQLQDFPIGGGQPDDLCKRAIGCAAMFPLVVCPLPGHYQSNNTGINDSSFSAFAKLFLQAPLIPSQ